jgi:hypothetical protein
VSEGTQACIRGCKSHNYHAAGCAGGTRESPCGGCLPRLAIKDEMLCRPCKSAAIRALLSFGDLAAWIRDNVPRGSRSDAADSNHVARAWAPLSIDAITDLDELGALIGSWVMIAIEEHPAGLRGPDWNGARIAPSSKRVTADGTIVYDEARVVGVKAGDAGTAVVAGSTWIKSWGDWYAAQPWADGWHDELVGAAKAAQKKWPQALRARKAPMPCISCDQVMLWFHPAAQQGAAAEVICHNKACGRTLTEDDYWIEVTNRRAQITPHADAA